MGSFFAELKRRNVYRLGAAYAVVAWVLLQLVNNVAPVLDLPVWIARALLMFLVIGFPIALVLAWTLEITAEGVKLKAPATADGAPMRAATTRMDVVLAGALAVVIALITYQQLAPASGERAAPVQQAITASVTPVPAPAGISIAVLPFVNLSGDPGQEFFSDGMTEEITAALAKVPDLRVVGRTSAFQFKGQNQDLRAIGQALGANHLVEGSVRKAGDRVRITVQLIRVEDGTHVWAETYDRELADIFAVQEDIAVAVTGALRVSLGLEQGERLVSSRTGDLPSYENYLRAKALVRGRAGGAGLRHLMEASGLLEQVVARDPGYAPAWALLAFAYALTPVYDPTVCCGSDNEASAIVETVMPKAEAAARRAIALDSLSAEGYSAMGLVRLLRGDWRAAADLYSRALAIDGNNPDALHHYSGALADLGYIAQAVPLRRHLQVIEPFVPVFKSDTLRALFVEGRTDVLAAADDFGMSAYGLRARILAAQGRYGEAADVLLSDLANGFTPAATTEAVARILRRAPSTPDSADAQIPLGGDSWIYLYVGAPARALEPYEKQVKLGFFFNPAQNMYLWAQSYRALRKTERFKAFVRNAGMVDYWRARGWPDLCRPVGADDFVCD